LARFGVETLGLRRTYQARRRANLPVALDGIHLKVGLGEVQGLLGPNRAGQTTLVKILSTALQPTADVVAVPGFDVTRDPDQVRGS
jgi:ABC-2 type transport system ATP-binding protein